MEANQIKALARDVATDGKVDKAGSAEDCMSCQEKNKIAPKPKRRQLGLEPNWNKKCEICNQTPVVPATGLCGPCTFGEADTMGGDW